MQGFGFSATNSCRKRCSAMVLNDKNLWIRMLYEDQAIVKDVRMKLTAFHHSTWRMTVNSSQPLAAGDFDRLMLLPATFHEPATLGDRSFTAAGPHLWNNLPLHLRDFELSLSEFCRLLKTHLFS